MPSTCPTEAELTELLVGDIPQTEREALEQHLGTCETCRQRLDALAVGDGMRLGEARAYLKMGSPIRVQHMVARLESSAGSEIQLKGVAPDPLLSGCKAPERLGEYEILGELGRGAMGVVFKARQPKLQRDVALKVILAGRFASEAHLRRFQLEAEAVARLDHPNIVPIYEIGEREGRHFFSMKLIEGGNLKDRQAEFQVFPPGSGGGARDIMGRQRNLARLMADVARAVHHAHQHGVLHRDLKPGNVLMDARGKPHLTDFGLAKLTQSDTDLTLSRAVLGTPAYMSPEQAAGQSRSITTASDIFSLGAMLYEMLTGHPPFEADEAMLMLNRVVNEEPRAPRTLNPSISRDLEIICLKCLEKEPSRRHRSAESLAEELERFARGDAIRSRPVSARERVWRWCRRNPSLAGALSGLMLVFVLGLVGIAWQWREAIAQRRLTEQQTEQKQQVLTRLELERAEAQFQETNSATGLANLARLVRQNRSNAVVVERLMNALTFRNFCLPIAPLAHGMPISPASAAPHVQGEKIPSSGTPVSITATSFSPDGRLVLTASLDGTARLWNSRNGLPFGRPLMNDDAVLWAQFSPDGQMLVTTTRSGSVSIWDVRSQRVISQNRKEFHGAVRYASFHPDGRQLVIACDDGAARVLDVATGRISGRILRHDSAVYYAAFSPDGRRILTAEENPAPGHPPAHLWDARTRSEILPHLPHWLRREARNPFPCFSPSGDYVLVFDRPRIGVRPGIGLLFSINQTDKRPKPLQEYPSDAPVVALAFSPDGGYVATGAEDSTARIWSVQTGKQVSLFKHENPITSVEFSPDGDFLLTGSNDRTARVWPLNQENTGQRPIEPLHHDSSVLNAVMTTNRIVTISESNTAWLWSIPKSTLPLVFLPKDPAPVKLARFCRSNNVMLASLDTHGVHRWNFLTGEPIGGLIKPRRSGQQILDMEFSPNGKYLATTLSGGNVLLWNPRATNSDMRPLFRPFRYRGSRFDSAMGRTHPVRRVRFSPDSRRFVTACDDGTATIWDLKLRHALCTVHHDGRVNYAEFSSDGRLFVTASWDKTAKVWNAHTGGLVASLTNMGEVNWARFDPSGTRIVTASRDKTVRIWSLRDRTLLRTLKHPDALAESYSFDFGISHGRTALATIAGNTLRIWDLETGKLLQVIQHPAELLSVRFSPEGTRLVTASSDGTAWLWDATSGEQLSDRLQHSGSVTYAEFSPDGKHVVTCSGDEQVHVWPVIHAPAKAAPDWLPELAEALAGQRIGDNDVGEPVPVSKLFRLCRWLQTNRPPAYHALLAHLFSARNQSAPP